VANSRFTKFDYLQVKNYTSEISLSGACLFADKSLNWKPIGAYEWSGIDS